MAVNLDLSLVFDLTASFAHMSGATPFGTYDNDGLFQIEADNFIKFANNKLGGNILQVELTNKNAYASLEEATLEYSAIINSYHAKSVLADIIGMSTGSLDTEENKLAKMNLALAKRQADAFSTEALVGGTKTLHSASIDLITGVQSYHLNTLLSSSAILSGNQRAEIREIFHFSPSAGYRFFDTTSAINYLHNEFNFESFTPETVFYLLPVWEDILRSMQLETSHTIRRSNYSYSLVNNVLKIFPVPTATGPDRLFFTYYLVGENPFDSENDPLVNGVSNLSNVPFGNIEYSKINSIGRQWIRRFALSLAKEILGQIRSKFSSIQIPNNETTLNGPELIAQAREEQTNLREELKALLEAMTYKSLAQQEMEQAEALQRVIARVPHGIFVG